MIITWDENCNDKQENHLYWIEVQHIYTCSNAIEFNKSAIEVKMNCEASELKNVHLQVRKVSAGDGWLRRLSPQNGNVSTTQIQ